MIDANINLWYNLLPDKIAIINTQKQPVTLSEAFYSHHCRPLALIPHQHQESALRRLSGSEIGHV